MDDMFEWTLGTEPELEWEIIDAVIKPEITVNTNPPKGIVFENYNVDGYPTQARIYGDIIQSETHNVVPNYFLSAFNS